MEVLSECSRLEICVPYCPAVKLCVFRGHLCCVCEEFVSDPWWRDMCSGSQEVKSNGNSVTLALSCLSSFLGHFSVARLVQRCFHHLLRWETPAPRIAEDNLTFEWKPVTTGCMLHRFSSLPPCVCVCVLTVREDWGCSEGWPRRGAGKQGVVISVEYTFVKMKPKLFIWKECSALFQSPSAALSDSFTLLLSVAQR